MKRAIGDLIENIQNTAFSFSKRIGSVSIPDIPERYEPFMDGTDQWRSLILPNGEKLPSTCIYHSSEGGIFDWHKHDRQDESIMVVAGKMEIETPKGAKKYIAGDMVHIKMKTPHKVRFSPNTTIVIAWIPPHSKGWDAQF